MKTTKTLLAALLLATAALTGCTADSSGSPEDTTTGTQEVRQQLSDETIQGKLRGILTGIDFVSESDYPYVVFEGDAVTNDVRRLSSKIVREKLGAAVKANSDEKRDITTTQCRSVRLNVSEAIAAGDAAEVPADPADDDFGYARHDKQLMIALKTMRGQLRSVVGFTFGTNESGDQDDVGTVHYVYVGISKSTGKLIAIMTQAVYT